MNIAKALLGVVILEYQDEDWSQTLDYEHIPFRCKNTMNTTTCSGIVHSISKLPKLVKTYRKMASQRSRQGRKIPLEGKQPTPDLGS
jgi:hypothetical protein